MDSWEEPLEWCQGLGSSGELLGYVKLMSHQEYGNVLRITEWNCSNHEVVPFPWQMRVLPITCPF